MRPITVAEAAERLRVSPRRVRRLIEQGRLAAERFGRDWHVDARCEVTPGTRGPKPRRRSAAR